MQNGVFVKKHILATADATNASVLFFCQTNHFIEKVHFSQNVGSLNENLVYYHKLSALKTYQLKKKYFKKVIAQVGVPDVIHLHILTPDQILFVRYARKNNIPYFVSEHWSGFVTKKFRLKPMIVQAVIKNISRKAEAIFPVSEFLKNGMIASGLTGNFKVIPNVVDINTTAVKKNKVFTFIVVADLVDEIKNISGIVDAYQEVRKNIGSSQLIIIGDGPDAELIKQKVAASPTGIKLLGRLENSQVLTQIAQAQCLIVNSSVETFSVVCLEARGSGLQVIATKCGGPEEFADENTILIKPNSVVDLQNAMLEMFKNQKISVRNLDSFRSKTIGNEIVKNYNALSLNNN